MRKHRIQVYTPISVIDGVIEMPVNSIRLSDYLRSRAGVALVVYDATIVYADGSQKTGAQVGVSGAACLALVDLEPLNQSESYMRVPTRPVRLEVSYPAGLRIEGTLHLREAVEYNDILADLPSGDTMRVLTDCIVRLGGIVVSQGSTILTDLATAAHILELAKVDTESKSTAATPVEPTDTRSFARESDDDRPLAVTPVERRAFDVEPAGSFRPFAREA